MNPKVDHYFAVGCGRCPLGGTPDCKVHNWTDVLKQLRSILLDCGLTEEVKWGVPCYTVDGKNVILISALKESSVMSFFKGSLMKDPYDILEKPGENSRVGRQLSFTNLEKVIELETTLKDYIKEAIKIEKAGLKVEKDDTLDYPIELQQKLDEDPALNAAFEALTPGRKRGYVIYFSGAKQSKTRTSRVEKYIPKILAGKGFHDR